MQILAPVVSGRKGEHVKTIEKLKQEGYVRIRVDGEMREVTEDIQLDKINPTPSKSLSTGLSLKTVLPGASVTRLRPRLDWVVATSSLT